MQKVFISIPNCIRKGKFVTFSKVICLLLLLLYFSKPGATIDSISQGEGRLVILYMLRQKNVLDDKNLTKREKIQDGLI